MRVHRDSRDNRAYWFLCVLDPWRIWRALQTIFSPEKKKHSSTANTVFYFLTFIAISLAKTPGWRPSRNPTASFYIRRCHVSKRGCDMARVAQQKPWAERTGPCGHPPTITLHKAGSWWQRQKDEIRGLEYAVTCGASLASHWKSARFSLSCPQARPTHALKAALSWVCSKLVKPTGSGRIQKGEQVWEKN